AARLLAYARYIRSEDRAHHAVTSGQDRPARAAVVLHLDDTPRATQGSELRGEPRGGRCRWRADGLRRPPCWPGWWHVEQRFPGHAPPHESAEVPDHHQWPADRDHVELPGLRRDRGSSEEGPPAAVRRGGPVRRVLRGGSDPGGD